jgi:hypothetical protein
VWVGREGIFTTKHKGKDGMDGRHNWEGWEGSSARRRVVVTGIILAEK